MHLHTWILLLFKKKQKKNRVYLFYITSSNHLSTRWNVNLLLHLCAYSYLLLLTMFLSLINADTYPNTTFATIIICHQISSHLFYVVSIENQNFFLLCRAAIFFPAFTTKTASLGHVLHQLYIESHFSVNVCPAFSLKAYLQNTELSRKKLNGSDVSSIYW